MVYLLYNRDILAGKKVISMSFKENAYQQMSVTDSFSGLTAREQKALEKSWAKVDVYKRQEKCQYHSIDSWSERT